MINTTRLRTLRVDRGYSIRSLAKAAGVDHQTIRRLENGADPGDLPLRVLGRIATAVGVPTASLLAEANDSQQSELQQRLGGAILAVPGISITNLATAAEASIAAVNGALRALGTALDHAGLTLLQEGDALRIAPRDLLASSAADTRPMTVNEARLLRRIQRAEDVRRTMSRVDRELTLPSLGRRGLVDVSTRCLEATADAFSSPDGSPVPPPGSPTRA